MTKPPPRKPLIVILGAAAVLAAGLGYSLGQDERKPEAVAAARFREGLTSAVYPTESCRKCHNEEQEAKPATPKGIWPICRLTENRYYDKQDKHPLAFQVLESGRGQDMALRLGFDSAAKIDACIRCHATLPIGIERIADLDKAGLETVRTDGVTCVACHGSFEEWFDEHSKGADPEPLRAKAKAKAAAPPKWAKLDRAEKEHDYGMTDLWDPARRAETCASCHIGSVAEGKVVTHAMYAAGHPPLPGFEAASFSDAQPRHWEYLREKLDMPGRAERVRPPIDPAHREQTELVAVSGLVTLREAMELFADEAEADGTDALKPQWPDLARYDCAACHHDLKADSWRQRRGFAGTPGRPGAPEWPLALVWLGIAAADPDGADAESRKLDDLLDAFHRAVAESPFGDRRKSASAARAVAAWADGRIAALKGTIFDEDRARALLGRLVRLPERAPDYDSARQIAWAFRSIYHEITPEGERAPDIEETLKELATLLSLDLPPAKEQAPIERGLADRLQAAADYDPLTVQALFARLASVAL